MGSRSRLGSLGSGRRSRCSNSRGGSCRRLRSLLCQFGRLFLLRFRSLICRWRRDLLEFVFALLDQCGVTAGISFERLEHRGELLGQLLLVGGHVGGIAGAGEEIGCEGGGGGTGHGGRGGELCGNRTSSGRVAISRDAQPRLCRGRAPALWLPAPCAQSRLAVAPALPVLVAGCRRERSATAERTRRRLRLPQSRAEGRRRVRQTERSAEAAPTAAADPIATSATGPAPPRHAADSALRSALLCRCSDPSPLPP